MAKLFQQPYFQLGQGDFTKKGFISNLWLVDDNIILRFVFFNKMLYFIKIRYDQLHWPRLRVKEVNLEDNVLLDQVQIFFIFFGEYYFRIGCP